MRFHVLTGLLALASTTSAAITWTLQKAANPTSDQADAYFKIEAAMKAAVAHYAKFSDATKKLTIQYEVSPAWARFVLPRRRLRWVGVLGSGSPRRPLYGNGH